MSITTSEMTPADIAAVTGRNSNDDGFGFGGNGAWWIILFLIFGFFGWGNNGFGGGFGGGSGATANYVLASDFATIQRQLSDGFNSIDNALDRQNAGICDLGYTQLSLANGINQNVSNMGYNVTSAITNNGYETRFAIHDLSTQLADCCCKTQQNIKDVEYGIATNAGDIKYAIKDCCCENEKIAMQNRFDMAQYNCSTLQAIDKVGDRIIDYLSADKAQALRDENQALRLAASQAAQNNYLVSQLKQPCPIPAYTVPNPNCCYNNNFGGCGV